MSILEKKNNIYIIMRKIISILSILLFALATTTLSPQEKTHTIYGRVYIDIKIDSMQIGGPYSGVIISVDNVNYLSDAAGYFKIPNLSKGEHKITFKSVGTSICDTTIYVNKDIDNLRINLPIDSYVWPADVTPILNIIVSEENQKEIANSPFWRKYNVRSGTYTKETLKDGAQRISIATLCNDWRENMKVFEYLDAKYGYSWRADAPAGIIGLDDSIQNERIFNK